MRYVSHKRNNHNHCHFPAVLSSASRAIHRGKKPASLSPLQKRLCRAYQSRGAEQALVNMIEEVPSYKAGACLHADHFVWWKANQFPHVAKLAPKGLSFPGESVREGVFCTAGDRALASEDVDLIIFLKNLNIKGIYISNRVAT